MKFIHASLLTVLFIILLLSFYLLHIWYIPVNVIFYSAIADAAVAALVMAALIYFVARHALQLTGFEYLLLFAIWLLGGYAFSISIPTVLDRSLSFYILEKLQQRGGGIKHEAIGKVFTDEYLPEFRLVDVRLTEQEASGTITIKNGCVKLTERGQSLASFSRFFRKNLLAKHRLLAGKYTDDLVDPFKNSQTGEMGYECN